MKSSCPKCAKSLHRSRTRSRWETFRRLLTGKRPYRCHGCNWRGWRHDMDPVELGSWADLADDDSGSSPSRRPELDLDALDASLRRARTHQTDDPTLIG